MLWLPSFCGSWFFSYWNVWLQKKQWHNRQSEVSSCRKCSDTNRRINGPVFASVCFSVSQVYWLQVSPPSWFWSAAQLFFCSEKIIILSPVYSATARRMNKSLGVKVSEIQFYTSFVESRNAIFLTVAEIMGKNCQSSPFHTSRKCNKKSKDYWGKILFY